MIKDLLPTKSKRISQIIKIIFFFSLSLFFISSYIFLSRLQKKYETQEVLVASEDLLPRTTLKNNNFKKILLPIKCIPEDSILESSQVDGKILSQYVKKGTPITKDHMAKNGNPDSISTELPNERWAFNLSSKDLTAPLPKISKDDHVEIITAQPNSPFEENGVIISDAPIISINEDDNETIVTLALLEEEARKLIYAQANRFSINIMVRPFGI